MPYFSQFPYLEYPSFIDKRNPIYIKNFISRVVRKDGSVGYPDDRRIYYDYTIKEKETPVSIATDLYRNPGYYWTILIVNNIFDIDYEWPMDYQEFNNYIINKYGSIPDAQTQYIVYYLRTIEQSNKFYVVGDINLGATGVPGEYDSSPVYSNGVLMKYSESKYDIEERINENKRNIKVINPDYIDLFVDTFASKF